MITVFGAQTKRVTLVTPVLTILLVAGARVADQEDENRYGHARSLQGF